MKKLMFALALSILSTASYAAQPRVQPRVVAQMKTSGGMMAPGGSNTYVLSILENGDVVQVSPMRENGTGPASTTVATLSEDVMKNLVTLAEKVKAGKLVDSEAGKPRCMDTPTTTYSLVRKNGKAVAIKQLAGCHEFYLNSDLDVNSVANALDGLNSLASIQGR